MQMKPREKLAKLWPKNLASWELIAIILSTGTKWMNVFQVAKKASQVIEKKQDQITIDDLLAISSIWPVKATQIIAWFELARRHYVNDDISIMGSQDVVNQIYEYRNKKQEYLIALTLDGWNKLIKKRVITIWLLNESLAHPREIFSWAISDRAHSLILAHNHPSWNVDPSSADIRTTQRMKDVWQLIGIELRDHVIIGKNSYFSFREHQMI